MLRSSHPERLRSSIVSEDASLSQVNYVRPIHVYSLVQKFRTQDMVTRGELVEIITKQREAKLLEDNSQQFMGFCIDSMRETYNSSSCLK